MKKKYKAFQKANPDAEFTYKEFQKVALQTRAFQYKSIEDEQLKNEMWRDIIIGAGILVVGVFCPPAGIALGVAYGALELGTAVSGKDWGTGRKLDDSERAMRGSFALLEIIPGVKAVSSFTKTIRASDILLNAGQTTKNSVKLGTNKMIAETAMNLKNTKNLVTSTVKNAETRIKNVQKQLDNLAKISEKKLKQQALKTADSVDRLVTNMKNINLNPIEDVAFAGVGRLNSSVENTHTIRDMVSKIVKSSEKEINFGDGVKGTVKEEVEVPPAFRQTEFASSYESRINQTPAPINPRIEFEGIRGESLSILKPPPDLKLKRILDEAGIKGIQYKNGVPDFSPVSKAQLEIEYMLGGYGNRGTDARRANFAQADQKLAEKLNNSPVMALEFELEPGLIKARDIEKYREKYKLTWHEMNDVKTIQLVPSVINSKFGHLGGVGEINAGAYRPNGFADK